MTAAVRHGRNFATRKNAKTVLTPAKSTITSKVTGTKAGSEFQGLPPTLIGHDTAVVQYSNQTLKVPPKRPSQKQTHGRREGCSAMARSRPCHPEGGYTPRRG